MRRVLIADDYPMCAAALRMAAHAVDPAILVDEAGSLAAAEMLARENVHDLIMLDLMLPDVQGFAGLAMIRAIQPGTPIAVVSGRDELATVRQAAALGARGFISKVSEMDQMTSAIRVLLEGGQWFAQGVLNDAAADETTLAAARIGTLSIAQLRVLRSIASGRQNKQIAYDLDLAEPTVKSHLSAIFRKLDVTNRTQAVIALRAIEPESVGSSEA